MLCGKLLNASDHKNGVQVSDSKTCLIVTSLGEDEDGFTPVLSKRQQKKLQEEKKRRVSAVIHLSVLPLLATVISL